MTDSGRIKSERDANVFSVVCPYLGLPDDPQTYIAWAQPAHVCFRVDPPQPIKIYHQQGYCLSLKHSYCRIFLEGWNGDLPADIRGEGDPINTTRVLSVPGRLDEGDEEVSYQEEVEYPVTDFQPEERIVEDLRSELEDKVELEAPEPEGISKLLRSKVFYGVLLGILFLLLAIWGAAAGVGQLRMREQKKQTATAVALATAQEVTQIAARALQAVQATQTALVILAGHQTGTAEVIQTLQATRMTLPPSSTPSASATISPTSLPSETPTQGLVAANVDCGLLESYTLEVINGPILVPEPGFVYTANNRPPLVQSSWRVKNTSGCEWDSLHLYSQVSRRLLQPLYRLDGAAIYAGAENEEPLVVPGGEIEVVLSFGAEAARYVQNEWVFVINGYRLTAQPHAVLEVNNWVIRLLPSATLRSLETPSNSSNDNDDDSPVERPTVELPTARP